MQMNNKLKIQNIHSIKGTILPTPNLTEKYVIWNIEDEEYQYRILITHNPDTKIVLRISRENNPYPSALAKDVTSYICHMQHIYNYTEIITEKWVLEKEDFKDKDEFIGIIGERVEKLMFEKIMKEMREDSWTFSPNPKHPSLSTLHSLNHNKNYKRIEPEFYTPEKSKPNLTHKIKKIMQGLGQIPDYIIHKIQYYIRKIV